jgi:hypothetical protein
MTTHRALSSVGICNLQDELEAMKLEVLALREALEKQVKYILYINDCGVLPKVVISGQKALSVTEESAARIKAGIEADVLEEAAGNCLSCCSGGVKRMAEERRAIAKGEK